MGIRFNCPNGHKLNVKEFLAGKRGVCPQCGAKFIIPSSGRRRRRRKCRSPLVVGLSQSVEIAVSPAPSHQAASASPSPSVIIPVTEIELAIARIGVAAGDSWAADSDCGCIASEHCGCAVADCRGAG